MTKEKIGLRNVEQKDWQFILDLRNQDDVRIACHDTSVISLSHHIKYMEKISNDPDVHQWIVTYDRVDVGHIKIVRGELGYMIKGGFRGKGIGTGIYELIDREARKLGIKKLYGVIKINQPIPLRLALKVGFVQKCIIEKNGKPYAYSLERIIQ